MGIVAGCCRESEYYSSIKQKGCIVRSDGDAELSGSDEELEGGETVKLQFMTAAPEAC